MKRKIFYILGAILLFFFIIYNVGIQIGNVHIGKQYDEISSKRNTNLQESSFAKNYLNSDSLVVVNLWATWCKPCIEEMPWFAELSRKHREVKFIFLSIDKDKDKLQKFLDKNPINDITFENSDYRRGIQNFLEGRDISSLVTTEIVPITYLIKNGKVIYKESGSIEGNEFEKVLTAKKH